MHDSIHHNLKKKTPTVSIFNKDNIGNCFKWALNDFRWALSPNGTPAGMVVSGRVLSRNAHLYSDVKLKYLYLFLETITCHALNSTRELVFTVLNPLVCPYTNFDCIQLMKLEVICWGISRKIEYCAVSSCLYMF